MAKYTNEQYFNDDSIPCKAIARSPYTEKPREFRAVNREPRKRRNDIECVFSVQTLRRMMLNKGTDPALVEQVVQKYIALEAEQAATDELYSDIAGAVRLIIDKNGGKLPTGQKRVERLYTELMERFNVSKGTVRGILRHKGSLPSNGHALYRWKEVDGRINKPLYSNIPSSSVRAIITALVETMPEPVQMIRQLAVHGSDDPKTNVLQAYSAEAQSLLNFALWFCTPYILRKIRSEERTMTGRVYERALHRTTDMGQSGRAFSDADDTDIIDRTMLLSFCPLLVRSVPMTDKGQGYVIVRTASVERCVGVHYMERDRLTATMKRVQSLRKRFFANLITEQEYMEALSTIKVKKVRKSSTMVQKYTGFWITWTCLQTGQKFRAFTRSAEVAERLYGYTSFVAESQDVVMYKDTSGAFGTSGHLNTVTLSSDTIFPYRSEGLFFRTLKHVTRNLFRYLFRRADHIEPLASEHKKTRDGRFNREHKFSVREALGSELSGVELTAVQRDICTVELMLSHELPTNVHRHDRRVEAYRQIHFRRTGHEITLNRREYAALRAVEFAKIANSVNPSTVHPIPEFELGPGEIVVPKVYTPVYFPNPIWQRANSVQPFTMKMANRRIVDLKTGKPVTVQGDTIPGWLWMHKGTSEFTTDFCTGNGDMI